MSGGVLSVVLCRWTWILVRGGGWRGVSGMGIERKQGDEDGGLLSFVHKGNGFHHSVQVWDVGRCRCLFSDTVNNIAVLWQKWTFPITRQNRWGVFKSWKRISGFVLSVVLSRWTWVWVRGGGNRTLILPSGVLQDDKSWVGWKVGRR